MLHVEWQSMSRDRQIDAAATDETVELAWQLLSDFRRAAKVFAAMRIVERSCAMQFRPECVA